MAIEISSKQLEKKITRIALELNELRTKRKNFVANLHNLNRTYQQNKINYEQYSTLWNLQLSDRTPEYWISQYESKERELVDKINALKARKSEADKKTQVSTTLRYTAVLVVMLASIAAFTILPGGISELTGFAGINDSTTFVSEANITAWFSVALSDDLNNGIEFEGASSGDADVNASDNYNGTDSETLLFLALSEDSNIDADTCINASNMVSQYHDVLSIGNMTYTYSYNETNLTVPEGVESSTAMTTTITKTQTNIVPGARAYYRFWIDVPAKQPGGTYNNTVAFRTVQAGSACT